MADGIKHLDSVPIGRIFLWLGNPRHPQLSSEAKAIEELCAKEDVYALARDIAKYGLNPLERFAVVPITGKRAGLPTASYYVTEGNRRLCALKLLNDPELAPTKLRKAFQKLSETMKAPIKSVAVVAFDNEDEVGLWLARIHNGPQGGIGRKSWNSEQKARHDAGNKNKAAQALLDYAQTERMLTAEERVGKLTTVQRFLVCEAFREAIGFDQTDPDNFCRTRPKNEFDIILKRFIKDLVKKEDVNSRMNKPQIVKYSRPLASLPGVTTDRIELEPLKSGSRGGKAKHSLRATSKAPERAKHVKYDNEIEEALKRYGNEKLRSLYHSICSVDLDPHTPLVAVGVWSFFETLTACAGRSDSVSFDSFLNKAKLISLGVPSNHSGALKSAVERIREYGNTTKHHPTLAAFNGDQLNNDMTALKLVILNCIPKA